MHNETPAPITQRTPDRLLAGRYQLQEVLGRGGMGEVHRAVDVKLRRQVAVKLLVETVGAPGRARAARFVREAQAVAALKHPNIVAIYDVGEENGTPFIVMELVEGWSLADLLESGKRPSVAQAIAWLTDIAQALSAAHRAGFVHRDVKPENLLLDAEGNVKIADFGIVKEVGGFDERMPPTRGPALTALGATVGTPLYMAPEQLRGEDLDGRADQYSWGIVAFELFAGAHPYTLTAPLTTPQNVADKRFVPPRLAPRVPGLPLDIEVLIGRALAAEPADRAESMAEIAYVLEETRGTSETIQIARGAAPSEPPRPSGPSVEPGAVIAGKYRIERVLGSGGMGIVIVAHHLDLDKRVALKILRPEIAVADAEGAARFAREGRVAAKIRSEHVTRILDVGTLDGGLPYIVMEFLDGQDLAAVLESIGPLPIGDAVDYVLQVCEALAEAHALGVVHRDIKPANLFLTRRGDGSPCVKLLDFGISKMKTLADDTVMTHSKAMMGSPLYMSPEQLNSPRDVDGRADVWAIGVTLYELLTGRPPFNGDSIQEVVARVVGSAPDSVTAARPDVPQGLAAVLGRCIEKRYVDRFADVGELAFALEPFAPRRSRIALERIAGLVGRSNALVSAPVATVASVAPAPALAPPPKPRPWLGYALGGVAFLVAINGVLLARQARLTPAPVPSASAPSGAPSALSVPASGTAPSATTHEDEAPPAAVEPPTPSATAKPTSTPTATKPRKRAPPTPTQTSAVVPGDRL